MTNTTLTVVDCDPETAKFLVGLSAVTGSTVARDRGNGTVEIVDEGYFQSLRDHDDGYLEPAGDGYTMWITGDPYKVTVERPDATR